MPELAAAFSLGFIATILLTGFFCLTLIQKNSSQKVMVLQNNLSKVSMYWSATQGQVLSGTQQDFLQDRIKMAKSALLFGLLFSILSWLGFAFLLLMIISMKFLAVSRVEKGVFASALAHDPALPETEIRTKLAEILN